MPTFLPTMRMNLAGNWFKLTDPEHLVFHTGRMMERGRRVQELRNAAAAICNAHQYREADYRVLQAKLAQLDAMLPMQSRVVQLPFDNSASGFDLFSEGATALVPELTGFSGVDVISAGQPAGQRPSRGGDHAAATFSMTALTSPPTTANYTIAGGTTSIADIFVFGKYISLLDTPGHRRRPLGVVRDPQPRGRPRPDPGERHPDDDRGWKDLRRSLRGDPQRHQQQPPRALRAGHPAFAGRLRRGLRQPVGRHLLSVAGRA